MKCTVESIYSVAYSAWGMSCKCRQPGSGTFNVKLSGNFFLDFSKKKIMIEDTYLCRDFTKCVIIRAVLPHSESLFTNLVTYFMCNLLPNTPAIL